MHVSGIGNLLEWSGCINSQELLREYKIKGLAIAFDLSNVNEFTIFFGGANDQEDTLRTDTKGFPRVF